MQDSHHEDEQGIEIHGEEDFIAMRKAGRLGAELLDYITPFVVPGARTGDLDDMCDAWTRERGGVSAPLGYRGYPRATCMSINHVVCHGIPGDKNWKKATSSMSMSPLPLMGGTATPAGCFWSASASA